MSRLFAPLLTGFGCAVVWLLLAFFGAPPFSPRWWMARLTFTPAVYIRVHLLPAGPAWLFGRESQGTLHQFDLLVTGTLWTGVFAVLAAAVFACRRRLTLHSSERLLAGALFLDYDAFSRPVVVAQLASVGRLRTPCYIRP